MHPWFGDGKQICLVYFKNVFYPGLSKDVLWFTPGYRSIQADAKDNIYFQTTKLSCFSQIIQKGILLKL